jgi:transcriptional regulator with GAF, ATPase, and Fis domain
LAFADGETHETERQSPVDGRWHYIVSIPIKDETGKVVSVLESVSDVTERKQAQIDRDKALEELTALKKKLEEENIYLKSEIRDVRLFSDMVGTSNALRYVQTKIAQVAPTGSSVLIQGETGVGKELVARAIHDDSRGRSGKPFIKVNCAAIPSNLVESELFGHEKGAFTDAAQQRKGRFELADTGTLFLDEISELPQDTQAKLLRVLQDGEFERVGSARTLKSDVRIIAATNKDLNAEVAAGRFRADLFYRLNVYPITVPPLRKRREDIPLLVEHFTSLIAPTIGRHIEKIPKQLMDQLKNYDWPGNVRELRNVVERSIITSPNSTLHVSDELITGQQLSSAEFGSAISLDEVQRHHIEAILDQTKGKIEGPGGAAEILGLKPSTLRHRMKKLGIRR